MTAATPTQKNDLSRRVQLTLNRSGHCELGVVEVMPIQDGVRLDGKVRTYYLKQLAQALAMQTEGVAFVENQVEVQ